MKKCSKCKLQKSFDEFHKNKFRKDGVQSYCKVCTGIYVAKVGPAYLKKARARNGRMLWKYLSAHPCVECGEIDPIVLQFDHVHGNKRYSVSRMASLGLSLELIKIEITKCEIRCANCHIKRTAKQFNWYKWREE